MGVTISAGAMRVFWLWAIISWGVLAEAVEVELKRTTVNIAERGEVPACLVSVGTNHFQFMPPPRWQLSSKPRESVIVMMSSNLTTSVRTDFIEGTANKRETNPSHEELLAERFASWTVRERFAAQTGLGEGASSDLEREAPEGARLVSRVIHVPAGPIVIEFALTAPASKFPENTAIFANLVNSFQPTVPESR